MANNNETTIENPFNTGDTSKKKEKSPQPQPNYADLVAVDNVQPNYAELVKVDKGVGGQIKDLGVSLAAGVASLPDIAIGIGDLYSGGRAGKAIQDSGIYTPGSGSDYWRDKKTINSKAQDQQFDAAEGYIDKTKVALSNPTMISNAVGESLAPMALGGVVGRGINVASKGKIGAAAAGAMSEGAVMAGSQAESIRQQTDDGLLTGGQVGAAMATGVAGSAFGYLGGRIAQKLGFADIDNMMANGVRSDVVQEAAKNIPITSIPKKILQGAISEGVLEELPQSAAEQVLQNLALGKPWNENLDDAIVMGTLAGMAMGGGINAYTSSKEYLAQKHKEKPQENTNSDLPLLTGGSSALEGEFIPGDRGQPTTDTQGRTTYEYDQFSTDADNLLGQGDGFNPMQGNTPENPDSPIAPTTPPLSRQMGINPEDGPLSGAAALAVDSGATSSLLNAPTAEAEQGNVQDSPNTPLSNAVPTSYQSLLGNNNEQFIPPNSTEQDSTELSIKTIPTSDDGSLGQASRIGQEANANRENVVEVSTGQTLSDIDTAGNEPTVSGAKSSQSSRIQPILGADGQNKWFASEDKANAFIDKKKLGNDYQVVKNDKRFEIQPKQVTPQAKITELEAQLANEKSVPKKTQIRKQIVELQSGLIQTPNEMVGISEQNNSITPPTLPKLGEVEEIQALEQQLAVEKSVIKKVRLRKQIAELQKNSPIDQAAHAAATSIQNDLPEPTQAQIEAGNYKKGHIKVHGLDIAVENPRGSERRGTDPDGNEWAHTMSDHYGYIKRTVGADQENIDTYVGQNHDSDKVYVVDQIDQGTGGFDEHKVMLGFDSQEEAVAAYQSNFDKGWKVGAVNEMTRDQFKDWLKNSDTTKPVATKNLKDSIENIRAEKIRQKNINDLHVGVYGSASIAELENSLNQLSKRIQKNHELSVGEMSGGKRSTRKAVASGAVDNFRKQKMDLEVYLKARKSGEVKQREKSVPEKAQVKFDEINTETGLTHHIPSNLWDKSLKLSDIIHDLASMKTDGVKTNILYSKRLLNKIAKLNPDVQVHIVSDLNNSSDPIVQSIIDQLQEGGFYAIDAGISYIYPNSSEWTGTLPELINHELIHAATQKHIDSNKLTSEQLEGLEELKEVLWNNNRESADDMDPDVLDRINYAMLTSYPHEMFTVFGAESSSRELLKQLGMLDKFNTLFDNILKEAANDNGQIKQRSRGRVNQKGASERISGDASGVSTTVSTVRATTSSSKNIERSTANQQTSVSTTEENTVGSNNDLKDYSRKNLKPNEERRGASPISTSFEPLSVVSASRRVLSVLQHLKLPTTQDTSISGRIIVGSVGNKGGFSVHIISSFDGLPSEIQNDATYQDEDGKTQNYDVSGVWHDGTLYVVADQVYGDSTKQLTTFDAYEELLAHEIIGHFGVQQIFGSEYKTKLQQLFNALGGIDGIRKIAKNNGVDMQQFESAYIQPYTQGAKDKIYTESDVEQALVGELFAFVAQNQSKQPFVRQKLKEVIGFIRQWFRERGFDKFLSHYNDTDLMMFIAKARKAVVDQSYFGKYKNQNISDKDDLDTPLYSRRSESKKSSTIQQVRDSLVTRFGENVVSELERQGKLEIIQDYEVEGVEGFYYNGKAVLVASNLTKESAVPTFLHELGGHGGFQNMMSEKQYQELMHQFDKLVEQGNPVAMAAKLLAEREQGTTRQKLEYLPYLLTLSSTMQQRNVIQRNALQKLINNIVAYVKAWAFDRLGINLNLNPDDMLVLSERMVDQIRKVSSLDLIRQKYQGTSQWMTAPNGANTHLSEQQWLQVRTPEFKKWFGDWENDTKNASQVLDENGEPKVVYHGTATEFNEFKQGHGLLGDGIYLTDRFDTADMYANIRGNNGFVLPLFVNIRSAFKTSGNVSRDKVVEATRSGEYQGVVHQFDNQEYIVALESNQVKMAEGNKGTFNSESADIRFSRRSNYEDITNRIANGFKKLPKAGDLINKAGDLINKKGVDWLSMGLGLLSRRHLTEVYGKLLPQLKKYNELAAQMDADKNDIAADADNIVREWSKLKDEEALANVMHDATLAQIDPAKPYQQGDNKVKYQQLLHAYNNLSPEAQAMYKKARNAYSGHYAKVREAIRERILRSALSSQKKADLLKNIEGSFGQIKGVYFPLARFGQYVVVMRNQNGQAEVISRAETNNEAESIRSELMKKYPQYKADDVKKDAEFSASRDSVGRGFMSDLFDEVGNLGLDKKAQADFEDTLSQLYLSSMPDLSWAKHGIHRKGTAGFSQDARRAFAQHMFSGANYLGKLRYGDQLAQQLDEMKKYSNEQFKKGIGFDQRSAQSVIDEMEKRHTLLMNPKGNPLSSFLTSVGFMYYMGLSPAAAMVNLSQTALIAYPLMGARWNYDKAGKELLKASKDFAKGVEFNVPDFSSVESFKNSIGDVYSPNIDKVIKGLELDAYNEAVKRGVIDVTQAHDLAGIAQGEDSKVMWYFRPAMRLASGMFHHAERFNREVTFIAAYRLATQDGATQTEAFEQAMEMVYKGHFDYSSGNRARFMQGNVAKVLLLFKQYAQNMIYTLLRNAHQSIYALDPKDQKEARRALAGILGMHALAAGAIGLPIAWMLTTASILIAKKSKLGAAAFGIAAVAAFASGGDDDDPYELENVIRNWLADIHPKFADLVFGGVPRAFSPVDLSGRVGLNNLIIPDVQDGLEGADWAKAMQSSLLGPVVGIGTNIAKGFQEINDGDYGRGIETMLPVVLKNAMKSVRFANEGVLTKNKDVIQQDVNGVGVFSQAIGFSPSDVKTSMEGRSAIYKYKTKLESHRKDLMHKWVTARQNDDSDGMNKAWAEIQEFNDNVVENNPSMRINRINLIQSFKSTERRAKEAGDGGVYLTKRQKGAEEQGGFAFNR